MTFRPAKRDFALRTTETSEWRLERALSTLGGVSGPLSSRKLSTNPITQKELLELRGWLCTASKALEEIAHYVEHRGGVDWSSGTTLLNRKVFARRLNDSLKISRCTLEKIAENTEKRAKGLLHLGEVSSKLEAAAKALSAATARVPFSSEDALTPAVTSEQWQDLHTKLRGASKALNDAALCMDFLHPESGSPWKGCAR